MGMAASQARLLTITARIHDVEYQSQAIQNAKVQLSTQSDQVYNKYLEALNDTTLTMAAIDPNSGAKSTMTATFNNLCSINRLTPAAGGANYALVTNKGQLILPDDVLEGYLNFIDDVSESDRNPYAFALYMMGESAGAIQGLGNWDTGDASDALEGYEEKIYNLKGCANEEIKSLHDHLQSLVGEGVSIYDPSAISGDEEAMEDYRETMAAYKKELYERYANDIYAAIQRDDRYTLVTGNNQKVQSVEAVMTKEAASGATIKLSPIQQNDSEIEELDMNEFNYYVDIYGKIEACGGNVCAISDFNGTSGDAANDSEWLTNMVESGLIRIENCTTDEKTGKITMDTVNPSSDTNLNYTETTSIDKTALAKAEAEYNQSLRKIDQKDKQYDMTLSKLESERTALTTEYDSVKKVIDDNIERTFGIFS